MIVKHSLYRLRMRDDLTNVPTMFNIILSVTLELSKLASCRFASSLDYTVIEAIKSGLETEIGLNL